MGNPKKSDDVTIFDDVVEGFADLVTGDIFDFGAEEKESNDGDDNRTRPSKTATGGTGNKDKQRSGSNGGREPTPDKLEGVTIDGDDASDTKEKGPTVRKQKQDKPGDKSGTGDKLPDASDKPD